MKKVFNILKNILSPLIWIRNNEIYLRHINKFKKYLCDERYYYNLIKGLDKNSIQTVYIFLKRIHKILNNKFCFRRDLFTKQEITDQKKFKKNIKNNFYHDKYKLPIDYYEPSVFYYKHGLLDIENILEKTTGKNVIDIGGFIGDSVLIFKNELNINKIYTIEPLISNFEMLLNTIKLNNLEGEVFPFNFGIGDKSDSQYFKELGSGSYISDKDNFDYIIPVKTLDDFVSDNNIENIGLIKWDIEGHELESILGSKKTINKYKPILLISIYHSGKDFFEIKPIIENWNLGYKFMIKKYDQFEPFFETMLIAY